MRSLIMVMSLAASPWFVAGCGGERAAKADGQQRETEAAEPGERAAPPPRAKAPAPATPAKDGVPDTFTVKLTTTKGDVLIDVHREWAPHGAERFHRLVKDGYYTDVAFFRVLDGFMAQAGIHGDPAVNAEWRDRRIPDDPVKQGNTRGRVSFAMAGPGSRTTQFFINYGDSSRLDPMGFAAFGEVRDMAAVDALYSGYGEGAPRGKGPNQQRMQMEGNAYLKREFPKLDYILEAGFVDGEKAERSPE